MPSRTPRPPGEPIRRYLEDGTEINQAFRAIVVEFARQTTRNRAAWRFGVSNTTVRRWMRERGAPPRHTGNLTVEERREAYRRIP